MFGLSAIIVCIDAFGVPFVAKVGFFKSFVTFFGSAFVELELGFRAQVQRRFLLGMRRWVAAPATSSEGVKAAGFVLQGSGCNFYFMWGVLVSNDCNLLYQ